MMDVHISQIPGLSPTIEAEDRARSRRGRIHDSDSDYIKLAKQGGHKGTASTCESIRHFYYLHVSLWFLFCLLQDFCGMRTRLKLKLLHTNHQTGSVLHQNPTAQHGTQLNVMYN